MSRSCGDTWRVARRNPVGWLMVADGLGHGPGAEDASQQASRPRSSHADPFLGRHARCYQCARTRGCGRSRGARRPWRERSRSPPATSEVHECGQRGRPAGLGRRRSPRAAQASTARSALTMRTDRSPARPIPWPAARGCWCCAYRWASTGRWSLDDCSAALLRRHPSDDRRACWSRDFCTRPGRRHRCRRQVRSKRRLSVVDRTPALDTGEVDAALRRQRAEAAGLARSQRQTRSSRPLAPSWRRRIRGVVALYAELDDARCAGCGRPRN
jgi:hypothetical protein